MIRERTLQVVLLLVGLLFTGLLYPLFAMRLDDQALRMMLSVYVTLGIFLLIAAWNPSEHRSLIAFTAWSSFAHAGLMALQVYQNLIARTEGYGALVLVVIGAVLVALGPAKPHAHSPPPPLHSADQSIQVTAQAVMHE